jgi:hypothetical protein
MYRLRIHLVQTTESCMPITPELIAEFLEEHQIETTDDLDKFDQMIKLLFAEPNIPLAMIN